MSPISHVKQSTIVIVERFDTDLNFVSGGGGFLSDSLSLRAANKFSLFLKNDNSVTVSVLDKNATDYIGSNQIIISGSGSTLNLSKNLLDGSYNDCQILIVGTLANFKCFLRVTYENGYPNL